MSRLAVIVAAIVRCRKLLLRILLAPNRNFGNRVAACNPHYWSAPFDAAASGHTLHRTDGNGCRRWHTATLEPRDIGTGDKRRVRIERLCGDIRYVERGKHVLGPIAEKIDALEKGASGFLCKPFTDRQLNEALRKLIRT